MQEGDESWPWGRVSEGDGWVQAAGVPSSLGIAWVLRDAAVGRRSTGSSRRGPGRGPGGFGFPLLMRVPGDGLLGERV